jgi:hypothetical protein
MAALLFFLLRLLVSPFRSISRLEAENAALRRQLIVLQRKVRGRVQFTNGDRLLFLQLRIAPSRPAAAPIAVAVSTVRSAGAPHDTTSGRLRGRKPDVRHESGHEATGISRCFGWCGDIAVRRAGARTGTCLSHWRLRSMLSKKAESATFSERAPAEARPAQIVRGQTRRAS